VPGEERAPLVFVQVHNYLFCCLPAGVAAFGAA